MAAGATKSLLTGINAQFESKTGHKIVMTNDTAGGLTKRVDAGETFDVIISSQQQLDALIAKSKLPAGSRKNIASSVIGIAVKDGAPKPDISSVEAFKHMLVEAKTVAYVDPASGGTSGIYIAGVIDKLGLTEAMKPKLRLQGGRLCGRTRRQGRGRDRHPSGERDPAGQRRHTDRRIAGGDPERHRL